MSAPDRKPARPSRSGGDTPETAEGILDAGGNLDPRALHRRAAAKARKERVEAEAARAGGVEDADLERPGGAQPDDEDAPSRVAFVLQRDLRTRLDKYLSARIRFLSRTQLQRLIADGGVTVNGRAPKASTALGIGDRVEVFVPPPPSTEITPEDIPLDVLFEDDWIVVINKAPDILVHPARSHLSGTMVNALAYHLRHRSSGALSAVGKELARPGVVHRLDRQTSGLIVFAKDEESHWKLGRQFERRTVDKRYLAVVHGVVEPPVDVIDLPLGPHPSREKGYREKYVVRHDALGKPSVTICRVREVYPGPALTPDQRAMHPGRGAYSLVELELKTGRTHQIRVHLSHRRYPIAGDDMYGGTPVVPADLGAPGEAPVLERQALHAGVLAFRHPVSDQPLRFVAPLRGDMRRLVELLREREARLGRAWCHPPPPPGATVDLGILMAP